MFLPHTLGQDLSRFVLVAIFSNNYVIPLLKYSTVTINSIVGRVKNWNPHRSCNLFCYAKKEEDKQK